MRRSLQILSVPTVALLLLIGILAATTMSVVAFVLDSKPAFAQQKGPAQCIETNRVLVGARQAASICTPRP